MTGSVQIRKGKYWVALNRANSDGQRTDQIWINTYMPERGNKKRANEVLAELSTIEPNMFTDRFVVAIKQHFKFYSSMYSDRENSIPMLIVKLINDYKEQKPNEPNGEDDRANMLFCDFPPLWFKDRKDKIEQTTMHGYTRVYNNHIYPYFKGLGVTMNEVNEEHIKGYMERVKSTGIGANTLRKHYTLIRSFFAYAIKLRIIAWNPTDYVVKPKLVRYESKFYTREEMNQLMQVSEGTNLETVIKLACYYGLRRSEVLGLKWDAIDFNSNMITVRNKVLMVHDEVSGENLPVASPNLKSISSRRSLPMSKTMKEYLQKVKKQQEKDALYFGNSYDSKWDGYVCRKPNGTIIMPSYVRTMFGRLLKRHNMRVVRFHDLRHSCATLLLQSGFNMREVQEWLGHSDYSITAKTYAHVDYRDKAKMSDSLDTQLQVSDKKTEEGNEQEKGALLKAAKILLEDGVEIPRIKEITGVDISAFLPVMS